MKDIKEIIALLKPKQIFGNTFGSYSSVCYNSLKCEPYSLFVAIRGTKVDGHDFIEHAILRGAKFIICERLPGNLNQNCTYIVVDNTRIALAEVSNHWFGYPTKKLQIIGVTGTNGKTTVTYLLEKIMRAFGKNPAVVGTLGVSAEGYSESLQNTTPESFELFRIFKRLVDSGVDFVAMEVSSHSLHQNRVYGIEFAGAIFTNLTQDHLDYHNDMDEYAYAKSILFRNLPSDAIAVGFKDNSYVDKVLSQTHAKRVFYVGRNPVSDVVITNEKFSFDFTEFDLQFNNDYFRSSKIHFKSRLPGRFNVENLALSATMALSLGVDVETVVKAIEDFPGVAGRMQKVFLKNGALGIVDYAHTPDALKKALETCRELLLASNLQGQLICVFGCGGERDSEKRPKMGRIASELADYVVLTNDNPRRESPAKILNQIYSGITNEGKKKVIQIGNRDEAIEYAYKLSRANDIILVAG
ncbi:MAG: UDP-N-acetylmuramoyl-L-alanyl-D-glutamate--2,6-diaminopimelate ligase, partial [Candidatus Kapaibacteriota bacterium]